MAKRLEYAVSVERDGALLAEGRDRLEPGETWTPEHLVLAALCRCTLASLRFHAERDGVRTAGSASARGVVAERKPGGRYALVEIRCSVDVEVEPAPDELAGLLARAERDCFVGSSLTAPVEYEWRVNGEPVSV